MIDGGIRACDIEGCERPVVLVAIVTDGEVWYCRPHALEREERIKTAQQELEKWYEEHPV
jgi:hypothetical protein